MPKIVKSILDKILLLAAAAILAAAGCCTFYATSAYHLPRELPFAVWIGIGFIIVLGRSVRHMFRRPFFIPFFIAWILVQTTVTVLATRRFDIFGVFAIAMFVLFGGYLITFCLFGAPGRKSGGKKSSAAVGTSMGKQGGNRGHP